MNIKEKTKAELIKDMEALLKENSSLKILRQHDIAEINQQKKELIIQKNKLCVQKNENKTRAELLNTANKELRINNKEIEKRESDLIIANKELVIQKNEKEKRAVLLLNAINKLVSEKKEKEKYAAELQTTNRKLALQYVEKEKRAAELIIANKKLNNLVLERKQTEEILNDIIDKNPMSIQIIDKNGFTYKVNPAHTLLFGALPPSNFSIFDDKQLKQQGLAVLFERLINGEVIKFPDTTYNAHDLNSSFPDVPVWIRAIGFPLNDSNGKSERFVLMHENITERKQAEEALIISEAKLNEAIKISMLGTWEYNVELDQFTFNDQYYSLLHTTAEMEGGYIMSSADYAQKFVFPDDMAMVGLEIQKVLETTDPNYRTQLDHRIIRADGETGYIAVHIRIEKDENGRTVKTHGVNQDITERKLAETELQKRIDELELFHTLVVGRELKMIELEKEINELLIKQGGKAKY